MPSALDITNRIASAAACLLEHGHPDVAEALRLIPFGIPFEKAIGAPPGWLSAARVRQRDAVLASLVRHFGRLSVNDLSGRIASMLAHYHASGWESDRRAGRRPPGVRGVMYDFLCVSKPLGSDRLRQLITDRVGKNDGGD